MMNPLQSVFSDHDALGAWYSPVQLSAASILQLAQRPKTVAQVVKVLRRLQPDPYAKYMLSYYQNGLAKFSDAWDFADITTVLCAAAQLIQPVSYMEIGVRRGRSMAVVASQSPKASIYGFDMWVQNYAGIENPGSDFVRSEMKRVKHRGPLELISGNSHETVKAFFKKNPEAVFSMITVDGDHSDEGALEDLADVLPHLALGGVLVFDDVSHPAHPGLPAIWEKALKDAPFPVSSAVYKNLGYGVACAVRTA